MTVCHTCGSKLSSLVRCMKCGASQVNPKAQNAPSTGFKTLDGVQREMAIKTELATITRVEKWDNLNANFSTHVSGGGGYIHNGTGHVGAINSTTTASVSSRRNVRLYYLNGNGVEKNLTFNGGDLDITEGSNIEIQYYELKGFEPLVAGIYNSKNNNWYWFNSPNRFIGQWINLRTDYSAAKWSITLVLSVILWVPIFESRFFSRNDGEAWFLLFISVMLMVLFVVSIKRLYRWFDIRASGLKGRTVHQDYYDSAIEYINSVINENIVKKYKI